MSALSRRGLMGGAAALAPAVAVGTGAALATPPALARPHPDEALLRLGERLAVSARADRVAWKLAQGEHDNEGPFTLAAEAQQERTTEIVEEIERHAATTPAGLMVKLRAVFWCQGEPATWEREGCTNERIMAGVHDDLAAMDLSARGAA